MWCVHRSRFPGGFTSRHFVMYLMSLVILLAVKSTLSDIKRATSDFKNYCVYVYQLPRAAVTKYQNEGLKQELILLQLWKLEVQNQDVRRAMIPLKALGQSFFTSPTSLMTRAILGLLWLLVASP